MSAPRGRQKKRKRGKRRLVPGHWKTVRYGPSRRFKKRVWVEPYWTTAK